MKFNRINRCISFLYKLAFILLFAYSQAFSQTKIDSLQKEASQAVGKEKVQILLQLSWQLRNSNPQKALKYAQSAIILSELRNFEQEHIKALSFAGVAEKNLGNYLNSLTYYFEALQIAEKRNYKEDIAYSKINIGNVYIYRQEYKSAIPQLEEALKVASEIKNKEIIAYANLNLGRVYSNLNNYSKALNYLNTALQLRQQLNDTAGIYVCYKYLGDVYFSQNKISNAKIFYYDAIELAKNQKFDTDLLSDANNRLSRCYLSENNFKEAENAAIKSFEYATQINSTLRLRDATFTLFEIYKLTKNAEKSLFFYQKFITYRDSLTNVHNIKEITQLEEKYKYEKENEIKLLEAEKAQLIIDEKFKRERNRQYYLFVLALGLLAFSIVIFKHNLVRKKANKDLQNQRDTIAKQNEEIRDSILYAAKIQNAILPPKSEINKFYPENFILYLPRNIVSGDFYWAKTLNYNGIEHLILVAADCTGHGVPGAFMSMLGVAFLNEIVNHYSHVNELTSDKILNELREKVITSLNQSGTERETKDGMDISLCLIDTQSLKMQFSGAYNFIFIARENEEIIKVSADKMPIGVYPREKKDFTRTEFQLLPNDRIYLFSDGFPDQFGGDKNSKFLIKNFKQLISDSYQNDMKTQEMIFKNAFEQWKGDRKQLDDILVMGIKIQINKSVF